MLEPEDLTLKVLIVGCGNIAGGFDEKNMVNELPLTHAGAYTRDRRFKLIACVEPNDQRRQDFMTVWNVPEGFRSISEVLNSAHKFDVISICSPTTSHEQDINVALQLSPKLIFCEKPITLQLSTSEKIVNKCKQAEVLLAVNYSRRWDPDVVKLASEIKSGVWGSLRSVSGWYNKGILNNGSHMLDLLYMLVGPITIIKAGRMVHDFFLDDPSIPVWLENSAGIPIHLSCGQAEDYERFELQFMFSLGVLSMEDGGFRWRMRSVAESKIFNDYRILTKGRSKLGKYRTVMLNAVSNIHNSISGKEALSSNGDNAILVQRWCQIIKESARLDATEIS
jgi:predicted dehydrogenase